MQNTTETFATLNTFDTLSQQELMEVSGGRGFACSWFGTCSFQKVEGSNQAGLLS